MIEKRLIVSVYSNADKIFLSNRDFHDALEYADFYSLTTVVPAHLSPNRSLFEKSKTSSIRFRPGINSVMDRNMEAE